MLINASLREYLEKQVQSVEHLPLAEKISFQKLFIENLNFPDSDPWSGKRDWQMNIDEWIIVAVASLRQFNLY